MVSRIFASIFILHLVAFCHGKIEIDKYLKTCDRESPDVNDCLLEAVTEGLQRLCDGIPELDVPPIDPYHQQLVKLDYKNNQIIAKMTMKDIYVKGLKQAKVRDVRLKADEENFHLEIDMKSPRVDISGLYRAEGLYNALKINASGIFNTSMRELIYTWKLDGKPEKRDSETFVRINSFYMRPDVAEMRTFASNIFPENPELTDLANNFANQNWRFIYRELLPYVQANWNKLGVRVANKIFLKIPYEQLFPANS